MGILNYILALLVAFLGLFVGFVLALIAKEELEPGKGYFIFLRNITFSLIIFFLLYFNSLEVWLAVLIATITLIFLVKSEISPVIQYIFLAFIFNSAFRSLLNAFIIESVLIFIYGIPLGSLLFYENKNKKLKTVKEIITKYVIFIPIAVLLFFL